MSGCLKSIENITLLGTTDGALGETTNLPTENLIVSLLSVKISYNLFNTFTAHNGIEITPGDIVFTIIGGAILALGILILQKTEEGGVVSWLSSLVSPNRWKSLFDFTEGLNVTLGSWLMISGVVFYFSWSIINNTWVDPGVYAVTIPLIGFGSILPMLENDAENVDG